MVRAWSKPSKINWHGRIKAVQPRIRLVRSFDERYHNYLGYVLCIEGTCGDESGEFLVAVGKATHERHRFRAGMVVRGSSVPVQDPRLETAGLYKTSGIKIEKNGEEALSMSESTIHHADPGPPFVGVPPDLATYRSQRASQTGRQDLPGPMYYLYLGLPNAGADDHRPLEPVEEEVPFRDLLLRSQELLLLFSWP